MENEPSICWESLFDDLNKSEDGLIKIIESLNNAVDASKFSKTGFKSDEWRNLHNLISKSGKTIEKWYAGYNFDSESPIDSQIQILWKGAIFETLIREGFTLNHNCFEETEKHGKAYSQLSNFINCFETDSYLIFNWIKENFPGSSDKENLLAEFVQFLFYKHLREKDLQNALILIKEHVKLFKNPDNQKMINRLITKCLYMGSEHTFPNPSGQVELELLKDHFVKLYCKFEKIPKSDPLTACNEIGTKSIPSLDRLSSLLKGKSYTNLGPDEELPIELQVDEDYVYHSIFCCPVIKQQSSTDNPAYLLPCSHALSKEALNRLSKGNALVRFKCPYCPAETNMSNCLQLNF